MKRYTPGSPCPKCAAIGPTSRFEPSWPGLPPYSGQPERIKRECRTCGFMWNEAPLDAPPEPE